MQSLVVFLALAAVARASLLPLAQPPHHPAIVLDPFGRPLDAAEFIGARSLQAEALEHGYLSPVTHSVIAPAVIAGPSAVSHQSRVDVKSSPAVITESVVAAPFATSSFLPVSPYWGAHSAFASPLLVRSGLVGPGHFIKKRSLGHWGAVGYATPLIAPSAVSHQSRVDVVSSPAVVSETVAAPVLTRTVAAPLYTEAVATPLIVHAIAPSAVSHQSRVDVKSSPTVITESVAAAPLAVSSFLPVSPYWGAHSALASPLLVRSGPLGHGHFIKKRSLGHWGAVGYATPLIAPSAVSHQSRVDVVSSPAVVSETVAAPVLTRTVAAPFITEAVATPLVAHAFAPSAVSHQSRVDVKSSPAVITEAVATPLVAHAFAPSAVSHQSRVDVKSSPAVITEAVATPLVAHAFAPSAVSHQSRVDVKSSPAVITESVVAAPVVHTAPIATPFYGHGLFGW